MYMYMYTYTVIVRHNMYMYIYFRSTNSVSGVSPPSATLVKKLVSVLEAVERLPVYSYDSPGSSLNLQVHVHV